EELQAREEELDTILDELSSQQPYTSEEIEEDFKEIGENKRKRGKAFELHESLAVLSTVWLLRHIGTHGKWNLVKEYLNGKHLCTHASAKQIQDHYNNLISP